jgi:hypothetical protein
MIRRINNQTELRAIQLLIRSFPQLDFRLSECQHNEAISSIRYEYSYRLI